MVIVNYCHGNFRQSYDKVEFLIFVLVLNGKISDNPSHLAKLHCLAHYVNLPLLQFD